MKQLLRDSLLMVLFLTFIAFAATINVPSDRPTIQAGINAASEGDTVLVAMGNYVENIDFNGKNIVVGSLFITTVDTSYISKTVIDGNGNGSVVTFANKESLETVLSGFTITNGYAPAGGGIYCRDNSNPSLSNLKIVGNKSSKGGGILIWNSNPRLDNLIVSGNSVSGYRAVGAGIYCNNSSPTIENTIVTGNVGGSGAGIVCFNRSNPHLVNVTVSGNKASRRGSGILVWESSNLSLVNTIIWNNTPREIMLRGADGEPCSIKISYSNVQGGEEKIVTSIGTVYWLEGNMDNDPLFVNAETDNFHLQKESSCVNAGNPAPEFNDPDGSRCDIGAYGGPKVWEAMMPSTKKQTGKGLKGLLKRIF